VPRPSIFKTRRPIIIIRRETTNRAQPGNLIPAYFLKSHAVNGHAEMPENKANQPLVRGSGPRVIISPIPPIPATIVHAQAAKTPTEGWSVLRLAVVPADIKFEQE